MTTAGEVTVAQAAADLGISKITVRAQFRAGVLTGRRITWPGGRYSILLIDAGSVARYRDERLGRRGPKKGDKR